MVSVIGKRVIYAFIGALIFLIANAFISLQAANTLVENNQRVLQTQAIITDVEETLSTLKDAETGQRGYLLTGDETFLEPYNASMKNIGELLGRLEAATADNPVQQQRIGPLREAIEKRDRTLHENLRIRREEGLEGLIRRGTLGRGKAEMDAVRSRVADIHAEEERMLAERIEQSNVSSRNAVITFLAANGLAVALLGFTYYMTRRTLEERLAAEEALQKAHDELEKRVIERTAELAESNLELERSNRELQDFAFVASHDLQEPLRKIQAFGDRLRTVQGPKLDDQGRDYLERMYSAAGRMHVLINDLLMFSRVTTKAQPFQPTDLKKITEEVLGDLETRIEDTGGTVEVGELPVIDADALQMRQLLQNLIANALKFKKADTAPLVRVYSTAGEERNGNISDRASRTVRIFVEDNGIGFEEKYLDRIFTPFQRLHGRNEYEGTGIGLAVCRKIVERHGGTLTAKSKTGEGATFTVTLPVEQSKEK